MAGQDNFNFHCLGACHRGVEIVDLKPQQNTVSVRLRLRITNRAVMVLYLPFVQLKYQFTTGNQTLILRSAMRALTAKQSLVPTTTCLDVLHANEWLWMHKPSQFNLFRHNDKSVSISSGHAGCSDGALDVEVLVAVKKPPRMRTGHVDVEGTEADVNLVLAVVDHAR
jgi:hypothetical protein